MKLSYIHSNNTESHKIAVYEYGKCTKTAVVLLHAFTHNAKFFEPLAKFLSDKGLYVICPDMPGRGASSYLANSRNYNYWLYVDDLFLILNLLQIEKASLFGNSMGGIISLLFTEKFPKLINKIILNDIGILVPSEESMRIGKHVGKDTLTNNKDEIIKRIGEELLQSNLTLDELEFVFLNYIRKSENGFRFNYDEKLGEAFWFNNRPIKIPNLDFTEHFNNISKTNRLLECYLIRGEKSNLFNKEHFEEMRNFKNVKDSIEIPEKGHFPLFFEDNDKKIIIDWLAA